MDLLATFKDEYYPFSYIDHTRKVSRAIIINDNIMPITTDMNA